MEFRNEPRIEQQIRLKKIVIVSSVVATLATILFFIYTNLSSKTKSFAATPSGSNTVTGLVFCDANQNGSQNGSETTLPGVPILVYHDLNSNGAIDGGDSLFQESTTTSGGTFSLNLTYYTGSGHPNTYVVVADTSVFNGSIYTTSSTYAISFASAGNSSGNNDFGFANACGDKGINYISGMLFNDANQDGVLDSSETGINQVNVVLYHDADGSGTISSGDIVVDSSRTDANGNYNFYVVYISSEDSVSKNTKNKPNDGYETASTISTKSKNIDLQAGTAALRFTQIGVPQGATIVSAYLTVKAESNSNTSSSTVNIYAEDASTSSALNEHTNNILSRTKTSASSSWDVPTFTQNDWYNSSDLKAVVQEIVNRSDWSSGNTLTLLLESGSGSSRSILTADDSKDNSPVLQINYLVAGLTTNQFIVEIDTNSNPDLQGMTSNAMYTVGFANSGRNNMGAASGGFSPGTLPVELIYFKANKADEFSVDLKWATAMEENNSHFEVERRVGNGAFETIDRVQGNGNSDVIISYNYTDFDYPSNAEIVYYRLRQVDFDGKFEYSPIVYVGGGERTPMNIFPNPADDKFTVSIPGETFDIQLITSTGVPVHEIRDVYDQVSIPTTSLHNGYYVARVVVNGEERSQKILIRHLTN